MIAAKVRADSFAATLSPAQMWSLYDHHYQVSKGKWELSAAWAEQEFQLARQPSRTAFYDWLAQMSKLEGARLREIRDLCDERIEERAKLLKVQDESVIRSIKAEALDAGLVERDWEKAAMIMDLAHGIESAAFKQADLDLKEKQNEIKERAQSVKEEELKIAQQKLEIELAKSAKAVETLKQDKLSPEEKDQKLKEIFGLS